MARTCGVEIGSDALKYAVLETRGKAVRVAAYGRVPLEEGESPGAALEQICARDPAARLLRSASLRVALGTTAAILRILSLPAMPRRDLDAVVEGEIRKDLDMLAEETAYAWHVLPGSAREKRSVLAALTPRARIDSIRTDLESHGFRPDVLTTSGLALVEHVRSGAGPGSEGEAFAVLHLGAGRMVFGIVQGGSIRHLRDLGVGVDASLLERNEERFAATGTDGPDWDAVEQMSRGLDEMTTVARQIQRTLDSRQDPQHPVGTLFLAGDVTRAEAMVPLLVNELGIPVRLLDPWSGTDTRHISPEFREEGPVYALPIVLARSGRGTILQFGPPPEDAPKRTALWAGVLVACMAAAAMAGVADHMAGRTAGLRAQVQAREAAVREAGSPPTESGASAGSWARRARSAGLPLDPLLWTGAVLPEDGRVRELDLSRADEGWRVVLGATLSGSGSERRLRAWNAAAGALERDPRVRALAIEPIGDQGATGRGPLPLAARFVLADPASGTGQPEAPATELRP